MVVVLQLGISIPNGQGDPLVIQNYLNSDPAVACLPSAADADVLLPDHQEELHTDQADSCLLLGHRYRWLRIRYLVSGWRIYAVSTGTLGHR